MPRGGQTVPISTADQVPFPGLVLLSDVMPKQHRPEPFIKLYYNR